LTDGIFNFGQSSNALQLLFGDAFFSGRQWVLRGNTNIDGLSHYVRPEREA